MPDTLINDFFPGETVAFIFDVSINDVAVDISADTLTMRIKNRKGDADGSAVISEDADVTSSPVTGRALFSLTPTETNITPEDYYLDIEWIRSDGSNYIVQDQDIRVKTRVSDS